MMTLLFGFLIGLATPIFLDVYRDARKKQGRIELMKAEASAFARAARVSAGIGFWDSTEVRHLATLLEDRYSKESERWIAVSDPTCRAALTTFYMECVGYLALRQFYEEQFQAAAHTTSQKPEEIIPNTYRHTPPKAEEIRSTYTNLADRAEKLQALLEKEQPLFWRALWSRRCA
jgi:hypothetical protein